MIVIHLLLPRFLVLEVVLFFHFLQLGQCSKKASTYFQSTGEALKRKNVSDNNVHRFENATYVLELKNAVADKPINDGRPENTASCKFNLNEETLKWMPLFYSTKSNSYLMPMSDATFHHVRTKDKRRKNPKIDKVRELNENFVYSRPRWLRLNSVENDEIIAICPGTKFKAINTATTRLSCINGKRSLLINQRPSSNKAASLSQKAINFSDLSCAKSIKETILSTDQSCGPPSGHGKLSHIGWTREHDKISSFTAQITICHDHGRENTYFTNHTIYGQAIDSRDSGKSRQVPFKEGGTQFYASSSAAKAYKIASQMQLFAKMLPDVEKRSRIFNPGRKHNLYLSKGHLSPEADFVWKEWQDATYYYFNAAPQWQSFNNGNWKAVEHAVRKYADKKRVNLKVFTGVEGQLRIGESRIPVKLAAKIDSVKKVTNDLMFVPLHFWKLIYNDKDNAAIIFVGLNDPQAVFHGINEASGINNPTDRLLCPNDDPRLCEQAGWKFSNRKDIDKGLVYCCTFDGFSEILPWVTTTTNILSNVKTLSF